MLSKREEASWRRSAGVTRPSPTFAALSPSILCCKTVWTDWSASARASRSQLRHRTRASNARAVRRQLRVVQPKGLGAQRPDKSAVSLLGLRGETRWERHGAL